MIGNYLCKVYFNNKVARGNCTPSSEISLALGFFICVEMQHLQYKNAVVCLNLLVQHDRHKYFIIHKKQLTGLDNANNMHNVAGTNTKTSIKWPYCSFPILWYSIKGRCTIFVLVRSLSGKNWQDHDKVDKVSISFPCERGVMGGVMKKFKKFIILGR